MFVTFQFPLADLRPFVATSAPRLSKPTWPLPNPGDQFVRYFGAIRRRSRGGIGIKWWGDEVFFCDTRRAIRFPNFRSEPFPWGSLARVNRRLFNDGRAVARIEVAFALAGIRAMTAEKAVSLIEDIFAIPTRVMGVEANRASGLALQGPRLARLFQRASTNSKAVTGPMKSGALVHAGQSMVLVEYSPNELVVLPKTVRQLPRDTTHGFCVAVTTLVFQGKPITVWFLEGSPTGQSKTARRALRLCLLRIHAEFQVLSMVLGALLNTNAVISAESPEGTRLEKFLDHTTRHLLKKERFGINQQCLQDAMTAYR